MTHYNEEKALVLYVPPCEEKSLKLLKLSSVFDYINSIFKSRAKYYYLLLSFFVISSVIARCIHAQAPQVGSEYVSELLQGFSKNGFFALILNGSLGLCIFLTVASFFSAFTVFALPATVIAAMHFYYCCSYLLFIIVDKAFDLSFFNCLFIIALFALIILNATVFFTEAILLYKNTNNRFPTIRRCVYYTLGFALCLFIFCTSVNYIFVLFTS